MLSTIHRQRSILVYTIGGASIFLLIFYSLWHAGVSGPRRLVSAATSSSSRLDDVFNSTFGFEKILVVNLPYRVDHKDSMVLAAAVSNLQLEWVDGVMGEDIPDKVLPPGDARAHMGNGTIGAWRAHLNAIRTMVEQNLSTALIFEDDVDWDVRIRPQLREFALATQALTQPLSSNPSKYADATYPSPHGVSSKGADMHIGRLPSTTPPRHSPYGDEWDVLWMGHCGTHFAKRDLEPERAATQPHPMGRVVHLNDPTVPEPDFLKVLSEPDDIIASYPPHTRVVHHAVGTQCSLVYGLTQASARHILYSTGIQAMTSAFDLMLKEHCDDLNGREYLKCITVQPQLFNHHRPAGRTSSYSDISPWGDDPREKAHTRNIRWSVKMNFPKLIRGETDYSDEYPDKTGS